MRVVVVVGCKLGISGLGICVGVCGWVCMFSVCGGFFFFKQKTAYEITV